MEDGLVASPESPDGGLAGHALKPDRHRHRNAHPCIIAAGWPQPTVETLRFARRRQSTAAAPGKRFSSPELDWTVGPRPDLEPYLNAQTT